MGDEQGMLHHFMNDVTTLYFSDININMHKAEAAAVNQQAISKRVTNKVAEVISARAIQVPKTDSVVPSATDTAALAASTKIEIELDRDTIESTANDIKEDTCHDQTDAEADEAEAVTA